MGRQSRPSHAFAKSAFLQEISFQPAKLLVWQIAGYLDESRNDIDANRGIRMLNTLLECIVIRARCPVQPAQAAGVPMLFVPFFNAALAHKVTIIFEQFLLAGTRNSGELDFGFLGSPAGLAAFQNVLFAGTRSLNHLIVSPGFFANKPAAIINSGLKYNQRFVVGQERLVSSVWRDEAANLFF